MTQSARLIRPPKPPLSLPLPLLTRPPLPRGRPFLLPVNKPLNRPGLAPHTPAETYVARIVGRGPVAGGRYPEDQSPGSWAPGAPDRGPRMSTRRADVNQARGRRPGAADVDLEQRIGSTGHRIVGTRQTGRGPGRSGQTADFGFSPARRAARPPGSTFRS